MTTYIIVFIAGFVLGQIVRFIPILEAWLYESREQKLYWEEIKKERIRDKKIADLKYHIQIEFIPKELQDWDDMACATKINSLLFMMVDLNLNQSSRSILRKYDDKVSEIITYLVSFDEVEQYCMCEKFKESMRVFRDLCIKEHVALSTL